MKSKSLNHLIIMVYFSSVKGISLKNLFFLGLLLLNSGGNNFQSYASYLSDKL